MRVTSADSLPTRCSSSVIIVIVIIIIALVVVVVVVVAVDVNRLAADKVCF